ncbi:hypothetical protein V8E53_002808 [Lactarius tabidus]
MAYVAVESDEHLEEGNNTGCHFPAGKISDLSPRESQGRGSGYISDASKSSFWNVDYYQHHFDVDTKTVILRCVNTLNPHSLTYTSAHLTPAPDLYGPFWVLTTLIFTLFVTSSLAHSIVSYLSSDPVEYDFALLSTAVGLVYAYGIGVPGWKMVEAAAVWGYAMFVWIPVSILCIVPIALLRWVLCGIAFALSGYFLVANIYPVFASADQKSIRLLIIVVAVLHTVVALLFKVLFFSYYIDGNIGPGDPTGINPR